MRAKFYLALTLLLCLQSAAAEKWDVGVAWLERDPKYPVPMEAVGQSNWPKPGDEITFTAHLFSNSPEGALPEGQKVFLRWFVNTKKIGETSLEMGSEPFAASSLKWTVPADYRYDFTKTLTNCLEVAVSYPGGVEDRVRENDSLKICLDALVFSVKINNGTFRKYTDPEGLSFFDRLNHNIRWMNERFAAAVYPLSPCGIIDRYRVDRVEFTDDEVEPDLEHGDPCATTRLYFNEGGKMGAFYNAPYYWIGQTFFFVSGAVTNGIFSQMGVGAVTHEAGHSLQLPDTYIFDLDADRNHVTHEKIPCDWMDANGSIDIMRYPYSFNSRFTELSAVAANTQSGVFRRHTPEVMNIDGKQSLGWMFRCLPKKIGVRFFTKSGRELPEGIPVKFYRADRSSYYVEVPENDVVLDTVYKKGGVFFSPEFEIRENPNVGKNTFLVCLELPVGKRAFMLDQLRFNYRYIKGERETQLFSFTNDFSEAAVSSTRIIVEKGGKSLLLKFGVTEREGTSVRCASSLEKLAKARFLPLTDALWSVNWFKDGENELYVQALSKDGFPSPVRSFKFYYDAEAAALREE